MSDIDLLEYWIERLKRELAEAKAQWEGDKLRVIQQVRMDDIHNAAIEKAAKVAEDAGYDYDTCLIIATAIRALKKDPS